MRYVLDASIAVTWCFHDEFDASASIALDMLQTGVAAVAPLHWWFEVRNVVMRGIRQQRVSQAEVAAFFASLAKTPVLLATLPAEEAVFALAQRHRLTFYDAAYLELAQRDNIALATLDQALARAAIA